MSSADSLQILEQYAVVILPALVVAEQIGVPLPAVPAVPYVPARPRPELPALPVGWVP